MNIQIFGKAKCFDTKKAERYFKERRIRYQLIDVARFGISAGELRSVKAAVGGLDILIDRDCRAYAESVLAYTGDAAAREALLLESPALLRTPIVRNGRQATVGYCPEIWKDWE